MQGETFPEGHIAISAFFSFCFLTISWQFSLSSQHRVRSKGSRGHELNPLKPVTKYFLLFCFLNTFIHLSVYYLYVYGCFACMYICASNACSAGGGQKRASDSHNGF